MLTDADIAELISCPKRIVSKSPAKGYRDEDQHLRCDLELVDLTDERVGYSVFIRQSTNFIENFSIGLIHRPINYTRLGRITLVRYNGPHGEYSLHPDGHFAVPHIHRITADEVAAGSNHPQENHRQITDRYSTYESALRVFWPDIGVHDDANIDKHFPGLMQTDMFDE